MIEDFQLTPETGARAACTALARAFQAAGLETPDLDARFLVQDALGIDGARLIAAPNAPLGPAATALQAAALRRLQREPVSRILGWRGFYGRRFAITPDVLDPRADTETVIDLVLEIAHEKGWRERPMRFADIGAGSGAIALTLLAELPLARAVASDVSRAALAVTTLNARALGVADRLSLQEVRGLDGCAGPFDLIVSNPPYIPSSVIAELSDDVRRYDPALALDGGTDGLAIYREIALAISKLNRPIVIVMEAGDGQADDVIEIFLRSGGVNPRVARDLGGHVRAVALERHC